VADVPEKLGHMDFGLGVLGLALWKLLVRLVCCGEFCCPSVFYRYCDIFFDRIPFKISLPNWVPKIQLGVLQGGTINSLAYAKYFTNIYVLCRTF